MEAVGRLSTPYAYADSRQFSRKAQGKGTSFQEALNAAGKSIPHGGEIEKVPTSYLSMREKYYFNTMLRSTPSVEQSGGDLFSREASTILNPSEKDYFNTMFTSSSIKGYGTNGAPRGISSVNIKV